MFLWNSSFPATKTKLFGLILSMNATIWSVLRRFECVSKLRAAMNFPVLKSSTTMFIPRLLVLLSRPFILIDAVFRPHFGCCFGGSSHPCEWIWIFNTRSEVKVWISNHYYERIAQNFSTNYTSHNFKLLQIMDRILTHMYFSWLLNSISQLFFGNTATSFF